MKKNWNKKIESIFWSFLGLGGPLIVAAISIPTLIKNIGNERFGFLALAWGLIGYAGALDLGIGRAVIQLVSKLSDKDDRRDIPNIVHTASVITLYAGVVGAVIIFGTSFFDIGSVFRSEVVSKEELRLSVAFLAIAIPVQAMSATFRGVNEAYLSFFGINIVRIFLGVINFAGPCIISFYTTSLHWMIVLLVISRFMAYYFYKRLAYKCMASEFNVKNKERYNKDTAKKLFSFGAWVTVSGVISPLLVQADRYFIGLIISAKMVSIYVIPYEVVVQSSIITTAISTVFFPSLIKIINNKNKDWRIYFKKWTLIMSMTMGAVCLVIYAILPILLENWIGEGLNADSVSVGRILCLGVFFNAIASLYYSLHQANGRSDLTAKMHIIELPIFAGMLYVLIGLYGVIGAAWAWTFRMIFDCISLVIIARIYRG